MNLQPIQTAQHLDPRLVGLGYDLSLRKKDFSGCYDANIGALIRQALVHGGLGTRDGERPLADIIEPGMTVMLKPNWVLDYNQSGETLDCSITHHAFTLAVLKEVIACRPEVVLIADAPIQSTDFGKLISSDVQNEMKRQGNTNTRVIIGDLRGTIAIRKQGILHSTKNRDKKEEAVCFDLGHESFLEDLSGESDKFRNTGYDPATMARAHSNGRHRYRLCKEPFEYDVFLNLPKLKCHGKAGISVALKNIVGINADKDVLPHHRVGGAAWGGDCYAGRKPLKRLSEFFLDKANARIGHPSYFILAKLSGASNILHRALGDGSLEGKWYGNDTVWRMVLDLNRLLLYGTKEGEIKETKQRAIYSITDGILSGEHNGPLAPHPLPMGVVTFGSCSSTLDVVHAALLRFDWQKIPLIRESFTRGALRALATCEPGEITVQTCDGSLTPSHASELLGVSAQPADGWSGQIESKSWVRG